MSEFPTGELYEFTPGFRLVQGDALNHNFNLLSEQFSTFVLTGQIQKAAIALFPTFPMGSWADFVTTYVGDPTSTDGTYQTVFVTAFSPVDGEFWNLLYTYFTTSLGFSPTQSNLFLDAIWTLARALPL